MSDYVYEDPVQLHEALINAYAHNNEALYKALCDANKEAIHKHYVAWLVIPYDIKNDDRAIQVYSTAILRIAAHYALQGDTRLMDLLNGESEDPSQKWDAAFHDFEELMKKFDFAGARDVLQEVADEMRELSGPAIELRMPYVHERLAWLFFLSGDLETAELYGRAALMGFRKTQNTEGILTVTRRLADIFKAAGEYERAREWIIRFTNILLQKGRGENAAAVRRLHGIEPLDQVIPLTQEDD